MLPRRGLPRLNQFFTPITRPRREWLAVLRTKHQTTPGRAGRRPRTVRSLLRPFFATVLPSGLGRIRPTAFAIRGSAGRQAIPRVEVSPQPRTLWA